MNRRVVITGLGLVTPLAIGTKETWDALCAGKSAVAEITRFDASGLQTKIAAEVRNFHPEDFFPKRMPNVSSLSCPMPCQRRNWLWKMQT